MAQAAVAAVPDDDAPVIPLIESNPDEETRAFQVAYQRDGKRVVDDFAARVQAPFSIFRRLDDLERASAGKIPSRINEAVRRLFVVALPHDSASRLLALVEGDEDQVGAITAEAIGGVVDFIRSIHYKSPTPPGSSTGTRRAGRGSQVGSSGSGSTSSRSPRKKH